MSEWKSVCHIEEIVPASGVATLIKNEQVAIFRVNDGHEVYAISNYDPFSKANVLSRGLVGDRNGRVKVASPIYKQNFDLETGQCLDDDNITVPTYPTKVVDGIVYIKQI